MISFLSFLFIFIVTAACPVWAQQKKNEVLFIDYHIWPDDDDAVDRIVGAVASRIEEWDITVRQSDTVESDTNDSDADAVPATLCRQNGAMGCFWVSGQETASAGYVVHLMFFSGTATWRLSREVETQEVAILADTAAMLVKSTIRGILMQPESPPSAKDSQSEWFIEDDEPIPASLPVPKPTHFILPLRLSGGYSHAIMGKDIDPSQGIAVELAFVRSKKVSLFASYAGNWLSSLEDDQMILRVRLHPMHLGWRYHFYRGSFSFSAGAAVGFIPTEYKIASQLNTNLFSGYNERTTFQWSIASEFRGSMRLFKWMCLYVGLSLDVLLIRPNYTVAYADGQRTLLKPWPVMPRFEVGVAFGRTGFEIK